MDSDPRNQVLLSIESACVSFGSLRAVDDVSLSLRGGNLLGLIGPNGAGKTTLMRAAVGLQPIRRGTVRILDTPLNGNRDALRHIGFTPDTPPMYDNLTVREFLRFIGRGYELSPTDTEERIDFWLEKVWLTEKANQKIKVFVARHAATRRYCAYPVAQSIGDPPRRTGRRPRPRRPGRFRQLLASLRDQGKALIVSSHILSDMDEYCTHIGIMSSGRMIQLGTVAEVSQTALGERCRYTVLLARSIPQLAATAGKIQNVSHVSVESDRMMLEYDIGRDAAAKLLLELMRLGIPVAGYAANAASLEETYLRSQIRQVE